ncbi:MAG: YlmH/Sll1252 family protein [Tissierellia bacterium]|nr:YlmH/Sll1252 family protein [Tissierellia bacterium]
MKSQEKYFDFIKDDETRNTVKKIQDKASYVNKNHITAITEFIEPYVVKTSIPVIKGYDIEFEIFPSYENCERKVFILYPQYSEIDENEFISGIRIINKSKFKKLRHRDYLGALMSLGIERSKLGDIYVYDEHGDIIVHTDIADYIIYNLDKIGHNKIEAEKINLSQIGFKEQEHEILNIISSSMRIDNIVKHLTNSSREKASVIIRSGNVKLNHIVEEKASTELKEGDILSISKAGRFKIYEINGTTKSGKKKVQIKHYI